jgi:hypothetical protein
MFRQSSLRAKIAVLRVIVTIELTVGMGHDRRDYFTIQFSDLDPFCIEGRALCAPPG